MAHTTGLHHITAFCGDPQENIDFYVGILGLRLVKLTVNFDDPETHHLYYGNGHAAPGTLLTFFPWPKAAPGTQGTGQATVISYSVPFGSIMWWQKRFEKLRVEHERTESEFDGNAIFFRDPDGLPSVLIERADDHRIGWSENGMSSDHAIRGFAGVQLSVEGYERTAGILTTQMGWELVREKGKFFRYKQTNIGDTVQYVDIACEPARRMGSAGPGTIHHVAFRATTREDELDLRTQLLKAGRNVTPVIDRKYFESVYFREPGHVLFEIATDPPGMTVDEPLESLGQSLRLPERYEPIRAGLESRLPKLIIPELRPS